MNCNGFKNWRAHLAAFAVLVGALFATGTGVQAALIVDDDFSDGNRAKTGTFDTNWWTSAASAGIEASAGSLGLVTGSTGRGIHTVFPTQTLTNIGSSLTATYTFKTSATVGSPGSAAFRVGLFDTLGRALLNADVASSSGAPNNVYGFSGPTPAPAVGLPGYMLDMDVASPSSGTEDLSFRQLDTPIAASTPTGRLMGTTTGFTSIANGPDGVYSFAPNTTYTGSLKLTRINATDLQLTGTLGAASFSTTDTFDSASYGMLAFWANSNTFGTANTPGAADNGIDFSHVTIEFQVPEPGTVVLAIVSMLLVGAPVGIRRRRCIGKAG